MSLPRSPSRQTWIGYGYRPRSEPFASSSFSKCFHAVRFELVGAHRVLDELLPRRHPAIRQIHLAIDAGPRSAERLHLRREHRLDAVRELLAVLLCQLDFPTRQRVLVMPQPAQNNAIARMRLFQLDLREAGIVARPL